METKEFETLSLKETCEALQTDAVNGLTEEEAAALGKRTIPGSTAFVPGAAGLILAGEVIRNLTK